MLFEHEKLDVYRAAVSFNAWTGELIESLEGGKLAAVRLLDGESGAIALHIAAGHATGVLTERAHVLRRARVAAFQCAACLDVLVSRRRLGAAEITVGKELLVRIVAQVSQLIEATAG